jgi:hypothetical protein
MPASLSNKQLEDFLSRDDLLQKEKLLLTLLVQDSKPKTVSEIKKLTFNVGLREVEKWNVSAILRSAKGLAVHLKDGWAITSEGKKHLTSKGLITATHPAIKNSVEDLRKLAGTIKDKDTVAFVEEAISCLEADLKRAAVILSWVGAISVLYHHVISHHLTAFNAEAHHRDPKWRPAKTVDDLARMKEHNFLEVLESISVIGKNLKQELQNNCLHLRNSCGHPNSFKVGANRVASHIEVLVQNVFSKF